MVAQIHDFYIKLKINTVNFNWLIPFSLLENYSALTDCDIDVFSNEENSECLSKYLSCKLAKELFIELKSYVPALALIGIVFDVPNRREIIRNIRFPLSNLLGEEMILATDSTTDMDDVIDYLMYKPIKLSKYVGAFEELKFNYKKEEVSVAINPESVYLRTARDYLKLSISVNNQEEEAYIERKLIKDLINKHNSILSYTSDTDFEYNQFFTEYGLEIIEIFLSRIKNTFIRIREWKYVNLPQREYAVVRINGVNLSSIILFPNLKSIIFTLFTKSSLDRSNVFTDIDFESKSDTRIINGLNLFDFPVIYPKLTLSLAEVKQLKTGDIILVAKSDEKGLLLDLAQSQILVQTIDDRDLRVVRKLIK